MADAQQRQLVRLNAPSILTNSESHESLRTWETKVKTYFSRDTLFLRFLDAGECPAPTSNLREVALVSTYLYGPESIERFKVAHQIAEI